MLFGKGEANIPIPLMQMLEFASDADIPKGGRCNKVKELPEVASAIFLKVGKKRKLAAVVSIKHCQFTCGELLAVDALFKTEKFLKKELKKAGFKILNEDTEQI